MAAVLSFFVPGLGHLWNGRVFQALIFLLITPVIYVVSIPVFCIPGLLFHLWVVLDANKDAGRKAQRNADRQADAIARALRSR